MQTSTKIFLMTAFVGALGLGGLVRTVQATQTNSHFAVMPQHHSSTQVPQTNNGNGEASEPHDSLNDSDGGAKEDGDKEASDTKVLSKQAKHSQTQAATPSHSHTEANEPHDSPNDSDGGAKEDAQ